MPQKSDTLLAIEKIQAQQRSDFTDDWGKEIRKSVAGLANMNYMVNATPSISYPASTLANR